MRAFANSRKARQDFVAGILEGLTYALPTPASMPTAGYKHVSGPVISLGLCVTPRRDFHY
jgi:hypothetical protein